MELTGRTYIFSAATLLLLAGALKSYHDLAATNEGRAMIHAWRVAACETLGIDGGNLRFGCHPQEIGPVETGVKTVMRGTAKTIQLGN